MGLRTLSTVGILLLSHLHNAAASPAPSIKPSRLVGRDVFEAAFGPQSNWPAVKAIDIFPPGTLFEGKPVDDSIIFSYGPWSVNETQQELIKRGIESQKRSLASESTIATRLEKFAGPTNAIEKRAKTIPPHIQLDCFNYGNWVPQNQLISATSGSDSFCYEAGQKLQGKAQSTYAMSKTWYLNSYTNSWEKFTIGTSTTPVQVYFQISQWHDWFDGFWCSEMFRGIIEGCRGNNPDTAGGEYHWINAAGDCGPNCDQNGCWRSDQRVGSTCNLPAYAPAPWFTDNYLGKVQPWQ